VTLHVDRHGEGPALLLLHGWGMHGGAWDELLPALAGRFRVHVADLPGHGNSASTRCAAFDDAVDAVAAILPPGAIVCGWSLGGLVAQRLAIRHAALVRAMLLVASTPCFVQRADWTHAMSAATLDSFARGLEEDPGGTLQQFVRLNALHGAASREAIRAFVARLAARGLPPPAGLRESLGWLRDADLRADAARIAVPTVLVHGARDMLTPVAGARWLAATIPDARLVEIEDAAHLPFFTHRAALVAALQSLHG